MKPRAADSTRRGFLKRTGTAAAALSVGGSVGAMSGDPVSATEASFYDALDGGRVQCGLCPTGCLLEDGERGHCRARENRGGKLYSLVYGKPVAAHVDPVEKKPFFHVYPGSKTFSIATVGCNIRCAFCQNWDISQSTPESKPVPVVSPTRIVDTARRSRSKTIAYTYSEPTIFYEYMRDCALAGRDAGIGSIVVSNGVIQKQPLTQLLPLLTAYKVDLKAFTESFYKDICGGQLQPVLSTLKRIAKSPVWLEIVVLVIPTLNDGKDEIQRMAAWIARELGHDVPLHFTRFRPCYRMVKLPSTPPATLQRARATAMSEGLNFVYTGNMPGHEGETTFCPGCRKPVITRYGFMVIENHLDQGKCPKCRRAIPGVWT